MSWIQQGRLDDYGYAWVENPRSAGSTYDPDGQGYPWRFQLHSIESSSIPGTSTFPYPPHQWVSYERGQLIQNVPLTRAAFANYQPPWSSYYTNRCRVLQCEIAGFAGEAHAWPEAKLDFIVANVLVPWTHFVESQGGRVDLSDAAVPLPGPSTGYGENSPQRLPGEQWISGPVGLVGHRHVPGNDHWDTGQLDLRRLRDKLVAVIGGSGHHQPIPTQPRPQENEMQGVLRRRADGTVEVRDWAGFGPNGTDGPAAFFDVDLVKAGGLIVVAPADDSVPVFNAAADANGVRLDVDDVRWGQTNVLKVATQTSVAVAVPADPRIYDRIRVTSLS